MIQNPREKRASKRERVAIVSGAADWSRRRRIEQSLLDSAFEGPLGTLEREV